MILAWVQPREWRIAQQVVRRKQDAVAHRPADAATPVFLGEELTQLARRHIHGDRRGIAACTRERDRVFVDIGCEQLHLGHKEHWLAYLQCLLESRTVRASAEVVQVHRTTSFRWRHRMVAGFIRERPAQLAGMVEADETYLLESQKGSRTLTRPARRRGGVASHRGVGPDHDCLLVACQRQGGTLDFHCGRGPVTRLQLEGCLTPVLAPGSLLISDSAAAYRAFAREHGISHEAVNLLAGVRARGVIHLNHVNGWHSRFKRWLTRFHGVASRYLIHYSGWRRVLDARCLTTPAQLLAAAIKAG